jgi:hypothetical protein
MAQRPDGLFDIRMSMLPGWSDCARMAAAKQWPELVESKGFVLRNLLVSVGAAVGTGFHAGAAFILKKQQETGALDDARTAFDEELSKYGGVQWDQTTPDRTVAYDTIGRMLKVWLPEVKHIEPLDVEVYMEANLGDGFVGTGHKDLRANIWDRKNVLLDHKTGNTPPSPQAQLGGYSLLAKYNGKSVDAVAMNYIKRVGRNQPQPSPITEFFDMNEAERAAWAVMQQIKRDVKAFKETGDPTVFNANPRTMLCSEKYCPAFGTSFCTLGRPKPKS